MNKNYINSIISDNYFKNLLSLRNIVANSCDDYFRSINATKVDLYLITKCVSSPMGKGSDSKPLHIKFGGEKASLADSSQFGMEPLVLKHFKAVYCYLPSFRGERPDDEHLNQFFHCEAELRGNLKKTIYTASNLIKQVAKDVIKFKGLPFLVQNKNRKHLYSFIKNDFPKITFDKAYEILLGQPGSDKLISKSKYGRTFTREGEKKIVEIITDNQLPVWVTHYDRDIVPFYQKPYPKNLNKALNADLLLPSINGGFGGEVIGAGQRQDNPKEITESMVRQKVTNKGEYDWYIDLRNNINYKTTSGFGLGIERFIAWMLCKKSLVDVIIFPRTLSGSINP